MPSFRRRDSVIDADRFKDGSEDIREDIREDSIGDRPGDRDRMIDADQARALVEEAEAEAAEADAIAAAARARARAARLRREALAAEDAHPAAEIGEVGKVGAVGEVVADGTAPQDGSSDSGSDDGGSEDGGSDDSGSDDSGSDNSGANDSGSDDAGSDDGADESDNELLSPARTRRRRIPRPNWRIATVVVAVVALLGLLGASGFMLWSHRQADALRQQSAEYSAAARQSVVTLMSLDFTNAEADVQRIIDNSTGDFKSDFESQAADFVKVAQDSKVVTEVTVNSTAVESMTDDGAEVLVAAASRVTNTAGANQEPRTWRLAVSLKREDGQIKMAKVEFVP